MHICWREIREKQEETLSRYAARSANSLGRLIDEEKCPVRTDFERDANRILYSMEFRRLRHKTQVFFNAKNDHICTRMEHVLYVGSISATIARTLNLNQDLAYAVALGHDLGHAPFGHSGEKVLDRCLKRINSNLSFHHELHSLRVADRIAQRVSRERINDRRGLNLTYEVRDGIVCHCGEDYEQYCFKRDISKDLKSLDKMTQDLCIRYGDFPKTPYTLEACIVKLVDKIAYVGRDLEDALRVKLIDINDIRPDIRSVLGQTNGEIINTLVMDVIENSFDRDYISLSKEKGEALHELIKENVKLIYQAEKIKRYEKTAENVIEGLFFNLMDALKDLEKLKNSEIKVYRQFYNFIQDMNYTHKEPLEQKVVDFVAGMTDNFALACFEEIFWM